jgi:hypothetical protein
MISKSSLPFPMSSITSPKVFDLTNIKKD